MLRSQSFHFCYRLNQIVLRTWCMMCSKDDRLSTFHDICEEIGQETSYKNKSKILQNFFKYGSDKKGFKGDTLLWAHMLLPASSQRVYNLQNKQFIKLFSRLFQSSQQDMMRDLEQEGDISEVVKRYFEESKKIKPKEESSLFLQEVEDYLKILAQKTKDDEQLDILRKLCETSTSQDIKMIIRIIKQDLRINAGAKHILDAFGPAAYSAYQLSRNLDGVIRDFQGMDKVEKTPEKAKLFKIEESTSRIQVMTPISPMLANVCKTVDSVFVKNRDGVFCEVKYDGERVQIHKKQNEFKYFSRSLKPVMEHKIKRFKDFIPKAFPSGDDMILDSEIILVNTETGDLLPFGSLGAHKKLEYESAEVCIFVFDCIFFNGKDLTKTSYIERRKLLEHNINPIKSYVQLSENTFLKNRNELASMTAKIFKANLEGVVLKSPKGFYEPGKRGWLKIKKDYLFEGKMADTADLVVLGGSYGSGKKGGLLSIFLMGCYDKSDGLWKSVTKVHSGLDDETNKRIHNQLIELMIRSNPNHLPTWFLCKKSLVPDYIAKSPENMPVWEITGAEFTKSDSDTTAGVSIRFPRITKVREDKSATDANDLEYLLKLYETSKNNVNVDLLLTNSIEEESYELDAKADTTSTKRKSKNKSPIKSVSPKKLKIEKTDNSNNSIRNNIFNGVSAFFSNSNCDEMANYRRKFIMHGGVEAKDPAKAEIVFHESIICRDSLTLSRQKYKPGCRHVWCKWIHDSIEEQKELPLPTYAVSL